MNPALTNDGARAAQAGMSVFAPEEGASRAGGGCAREQPAVARNLPPRALSARWCVRVVSACGDLAGAELGASSRAIPGLTIESISPGLDAADRSEIDTATPRVHRRVGVERADARSLSCPASGSRRPHGNRQACCDDS